MESLNVNSQICELVNQHGLTNKLGNSINIFLASTKLYVALDNHGYIGNTITCITPNYTTDAIIEHSPEFNPVKINNDTCLLSKLFLCNNSGVCLIIKSIPESEFCEYANMLYFDNGFVYLYDNIRKLKHQLHVEFNLKPTFDHHALPATLIFNIMSFV